MNLKTEIQNRIEKNQLNKAKFLLTISGGVDSMVLLDIFRQLPYAFSVAHCNFQLRGNDSDLDEKLVVDTCRKYNIPFFVEKFDVEKYQSTGNYSTEMACRNLRYDWFYDLLTTHKFDYLVMAHHLNDQLETLLINLSRGSGSKGLMAMEEISNKIFRPMLTFSKKEIVDYAKQEKITWREDITNQENDFIRNQIRNQIAPLLEEIHPQFLKNVNKSLTFLAEENQLVENYLQTKKKELFKQENDCEVVEISSLEKLNPINTHLHHFFSPFGFSVEEIRKLLIASTGAEMQSATHRALKNRKFLLIKKKEDKKTDIYVIDSIENSYYCSDLFFQKTAHHPTYTDETLDFDKIDFPLVFRPIEAGDSFFPLGMKGRKKVSKFLKDEKLSKFDKEKVRVLVDNQQQILWVYPLRIDERYKTTQETINFLNIKIC